LILSKYFFSLLLLIESAKIIKILPAFNKFYISLNKCPKFVAYLSNKKSKSNTILTYWQFLIIRIYSFLFGIDFGQNILLIKSVLGKKLSSLHFNQTSALLLDFLSLFICLSVVENKINFQKKNR
jgi:hypothetical protein